jgi:hypothetical protein
MKEFTKINAELLNALKEFTSAMDILSMRPGLQLHEVAELLNPIGDIARNAITKAEINKKSIPITQFVRSET